jgi:hypothetical protein
MNPMDMRHHKRRKDIDSKECVLARKVSASAQVLEGPPNVGDAKL